MDLVLAGLKPLSMFVSREKNAVGTLLTACRKSLGCKHIGHVFIRKDGARPETFVSVTYPGKWLLNYALRSYFAIDPVVNHQEITTRPIILQDIGSKDNAVRNMLADARRFGLGQSFVSFSVMSSSETPGSVMFSFDIEPTDFADYVANNERSLREAARKIHLDILSVRGLLGERAWTFDLTDREKRCLSALANGRTFAQIGQSLDTTADGVMEMMHCICAKLNCNNSMQAVTRALSLGLLEEAEEPIRQRPRNGFSPMPSVRPTRH